MSVYGVNTTVSLGDLNKYGLRDDYSGGEGPVKIRFKSYGENY